MILVRSHMNCRCLSPSVSRENLAQSATSKQRLKFNYRVVCERFILVKVTGTLNDADRAWLKDRRRRLAVALLGTLVVSAESMEGVRMRRTDSPLRTGDSAGLWIPLRGLSAPPNLPDRPFMDSFWNKTNTHFYALVLLPVAQRVNKRRRNSIAVLKIRTILQSKLER